MSAVEKARKHVRADNRQSLMAQLAVLREKLRHYGIRDASDYAEVLVAEAVCGMRQASRVIKGFDVECPRYGRIEVKCRQLPLDGRMEERVEVSPAKEKGFDYLAIVIFHPDFRVKGAVLVPYSKVWDLVRVQEYNRISFSQATKLKGAIDITGLVSALAERK